MASLKELDQRLFENYIELKADPIVGSLEPGIYAGYFDWKDCLPPTGKWSQVAHVLGKKSDASRVVNVDVLLLISICLKCFSSYSRFFSCLLKDEILAFY